MIPKPALARELGVSTRTISRWLMDTAVEFPTPIMICGRNYFMRTSVETWKAARLAQSLLLSLTVTRVCRRDWGCEPTAIQRATKRGSFGAPNAQTPPIRSVLSANDRISGSTPENSCSERSRAGLAPCERLPLPARIGEFQDAARGHAGYRHRRSRGGWLMPRRVGLPLGSLAASAIAKINAGGAQDRMVWLHAVLADHKLPARALHVAFVIADHVNKRSGIAWPSQTTIAARPDSIERGEACVH